MTKKKYKDSDVAKGLITGGVGLSVGSIVVGKLPASGAATGVQAGLTAAGGFFPVIATVGAAKIVTGQLKSLKEVKKKKKW